MLGIASDEGYFLRLNPAWERTLGWTCEQLMEVPYISFVHPDDVEKTVAVAGQASGPDHPLVAFENRYRTSAEDYRWLSWNAVVDSGCWYFVAHDITERKAAEAARDQTAQLHRVVTESVADGLYLTDSEGCLTYVNSAALTLLGYASLEEVRGRPGHDMFHHTRWDGTPYPVEDCPLANVRETGKPVRVDEDTFWRKDGKRLPVAYSCTPVEGPDGTGSVVAFRDVTHLQAERDRLRAQARHAVWFEQVRLALLEDRLVLYEQPIMELATDTITKHELLLRMVSPSGEIVAPGLFLPAAEQYGLIHNIDCWVLTRALELAASGRVVTANLSAESVSRVEVLLHIERELARTGASAGNLVVELTETALMHDLQEGRRFADRLVALGCSFALDDFGTGYGSMTYLRQLPMTYLKIDVQFVREMIEREDDRKLVQGMVGIAKSLGKRTIAEGVEDQATLDLLREFDVDCAQGYFIGRPAPLTADE